MNTLEQGSNQQIEKLQNSGLIEDQVSIMIRTFNRPVDLQHALNSVIMQTQKNLEIIIVNDGKRLPEDFVIDTRLRDDVIWRVIEINGLGRVSAANAAICAATGEYGLFLDDDDTIDPEHIEKLFYALKQSSPRFVAAYTGTRWIRPGLDDDCQDAEIKVYELLTGNKLPIHSVLFDIKVVRENQILFDEDISVYEDWDFWLQLGMVGDFKYVEGCSASYNIGDGSGVHVFTPPELQEKVNLIRNKWLGKIPKHRLAQFLDAYIEKESLNRSLSTEVAELLNKKLHLEKEIACKNEKIAEYEEKKQEHNEVRLDLQTTKQLLKDAEKLAESQRMEIDKIYSSKSWRYTSPLRKIASMLRNGFEIINGFFEQRLRQAKKVVNFSWRFFKNIVKFGFRNAVSDAKKEPIWLKISGISRDLKRDIEPAGGAFNPFDQVVRYSTEPVKNYHIDRIAIGASSRGNFFMREIGSLLGCALTELGVTVEFFNEAEIEKVLTAEFVIIIAPHEFFELSEDKKSIKALLNHNKLVLFNTEQPQTQWFASAFKYFRRARVIWDMSYNSAVLLRSNGLNAYHLPLGYCQSYQDKLLASESIHRTLPLLSLSEQVTSHFPSSYGDRPIDILFIGTISTKRSEFFSKFARFFSNYNCFFYLPNGDKPFLDKSNETIDFMQMVGLAMRSKIVLNIHRDTETYFEWQRIVNIGIFSRALVISETCEYNPFIKPNLHYLDVPLDFIPDFCEDYLRDTIKAEKFAQRAFDSLSSELVLKSQLVQILGVTK